MPVWALRIGGFSTRPPQTAIRPRGGASLSETTKDESRIRANYAGAPPAHTHTPHLQSGDEVGSGAWAPGLDNLPYPLISINISEFNTSRSHLPISMWRNPPRCRQAAKPGSVNRVSITFNSKVFRSGIRFGQKMPQSEALGAIV